MRIELIVNTYILSNISFSMLSYHDKKRLLIVPKKSKKTVNNELDFVDRICKYEFTKNNTSQTALNYFREYGLNSTLSTYILEKNDYSKESKKRQLNEYLKSQKQITKNTTTKALKDNDSQENDDSQLSKLNNDIDSLVDVLEALTNEDSSDAPVNKLDKKIEVEDFDNLDYSYSGDRNHIINNNLNKIKTVREDLKELLKEKLNYLYKVYNRESLIELQVIANNNSFLENELNDIDIINIDYNFFKESTKKTKKQLTKELDLLIFENKVNLDSMPLLTGVDDYVCYFLKKRKVYNYENFCKTYYININELRNECNLVILENLDKIENEIDFYNCNSYSELSKEDKKAVNSLIANMMRKRVDHFCQVVSNVVTIPVKEYSNLQSLRKAKKLNSMQSTTYELEKRLTKSRQSSNKGKRSQIPVKARITIINATETKVDIKIDFLKEVLLKTENNSLYKSNYYSSIIEPLNKNIEIKEACTNEDKVLKLDNEMIKIIKSYYILDLKFLQQLSNLKIAKILKTSNNNIKPLLEDSLKNCYIELDLYLYNKNLKKALDQKVNMQLMQSLTNLIY